MRYIPSRICIIIWRQTQQGYQFWIYDFIFCFYAYNTFSFRNVNNSLCVYECIFILFYQKHPYSAMGNSWAVSYVWKCFSAFFFYFYFFLLFINCLHFFFLPRNNFYSAEFNVYYTHLCDLGFIVHELSICIWVFCC